MMLQSGSGTRKRYFAWRGLGALGIVFVLFGCAGLPAEVPRQASYAIPPAFDTDLGRAISADLEAHPGQSAFYPLADGLDAFVARLALADVAERSLDVQYYLFHADATGRLLTDAILRAADRGVRVRVLLDDMDMDGRDAMLATLDQHPNVEIRLFNPFPSRSLRYLDYVIHFGRVTRRMHNKSMTIDNLVSVVGGRNIGDEYFSAAEGANFGDMDVVVVGSIAGEVSAAFDRYWNSELVYPVSALGTEADEPVLNTGRKSLDAQVEVLADSTYIRRLRESSLALELKRKALDFYWGEARLYWDRPEKVIQDPSDRSTHMGPDLSERVSEAESELLIVSPYFVPGDSGVALLHALVSRGVRVTVLTNSLAATDVPAVHAGYARYRPALLKAGVELYEMKPRLEDPDASRRFGSSQASLHAKTLGVDRESVIVGSMNIDPRSSLLNTEMGIWIESPELAGDLAAWKDKGLPEMAWRVELEDVDDPLAPPGEAQRLVWLSSRDGIEQRRYDVDPESGIWEQMQVWLLSFLPIEAQL